MDGEEDNTVVTGAMVAVGAAAASIFAVAMVYRKVKSNTQRDSVIYESSVPPQDDYGFGTDPGPNLAISQQTEIERELMGIRPTMLSMVTEASAEQEGIMRESVARRQRKATVSQKVALVNFMKESDPMRDDIEGVADKLAGTYTFSNLKAAIKVRYGKLPKGWRTGSDRSYGSIRYSSKSKQASDKVPSGWKPSPPPEVGGDWNPPPPPPPAMAEDIDF